MRTESSGTGFLILYVFKGRYLLQTCVCSPLLVWNIVYSKSYGFLEVECLSVSHAEIHWTVYSLTPLWIPSVNSCLTDESVMVIYNIGRSPHFKAISSVVSHEICGIQSRSGHMMCMALLHFGCCNLSVAHLKWTMCSVRRCIRMCIKNDGTLNIYCKFCNKNFL